MKNNLTPYEEGAQACKDGQSIFDYPYRPNTKACEDWMDGYMSEDKIVKFNNA